MGKRGPKPKGKVKIMWSPHFAYAIGLLVTDGNLSPSGRHIHFTSKDLELVKLFQKALGVVFYVGSLPKNLQELTAACVVVMSMIDTMQRPRWRSPGRRCE